MRVNGGDNENEDHELGGEFRWRKSSFCQNAECVEVAVPGDEEADRAGTRVTFVRDSKNKSTDFPTLAFPATAFADLVSRVS